MMASLDGLSYRVSLDQQYSDYLTSEGEGERLRRPNWLGT